MAKKYINLDNLSTFLSSLRETFAVLNHTHTLSDITDYTETDVNSLEFITIEDIDTICGNTIQYAEGVSF